MHFNFCVPGTMRLLKRLLWLSNSQQLLLPTFLAPCLTCAARNWKTPQGNIVQQISIHISQLAFPSDQDSSGPRELSPVSQFWIPCKRVHYKLLAADLCSASMFHEANWKMPWGGRLATSIGFTLICFTSFCILAFWDWGIFGGYKGAPRKGV